MGVFFYLVALMAGMNFVSHGTQDLYPTFLKLTKGFSTNMVSIVTIIANLGALTGGIVVGWVSDVLGRKRAMVSALLAAAFLIPLWIYAPNAALVMLGGFLMQFMVQGAWGVVPAHITELSPASSRGFLPGFAYQIGVLIAGSAATFESLLAERLGLPKAMAFFALAVFLGCAFVVAIGKERKGKEFL
jgi:SHS family lactate transporter-like MFS transporter